MKLFSSIIAFLIISTSVNAQFFTKKIKGNGNIETETRSVSDYDKIGVAGAFEVQLIKGSEGKITVKADDNLMEYIITEVKNGSLKIKTKKGYNIRTKRTIEIIVPFKDIEAVSLAGSGEVYSEDLIDSSNLELSVAGSGSMKLEVSSKYLKSSVAGSGNLRLTGDTKEYKCNVAGSGNINSYDLKANKVTVNVAGSGNVKVNAIDEIHAKSAGSGDIYYSGNPEIQKIKSAGSGSVRKKS